jgi:ribosome-interacting GTPase 1
MLVSAIVWGASAKHARGQKVGLDHILDDEDGKHLVLTSCDILSKKLAPSL